MNKLDEFKEFIKNHRYVFKLIETKKYTWQELFERYDIFGPDDKLFKEESNEDEDIASSNKEEASKVLLNFFNLDKYSLVISSS